MILLEYHNKIIEDTLLEKFGITDGRYEAIEAIIADFDGVLSTSLHLIQMQRILSKFQCL